MMMMMMMMIMIMIIIIIIKILTKYNRFKTETNDIMHHE